MAILVIFDIEGGTAEQYERINEIAEIEGSEDAPPGLIQHLAGPTEGGFLIADLWESAEAFEAFAERLIPIVAEVMGPEAAETPPRIHDVHNHLEGSGESAAIIMVADVPGMTTDQYDQMVGDIPDHDTGHPSVYHIAAITDDGLLVVDVWESEEAFGSFIDQQVGPAGEQAEMPEFTPRIVPVHNRMTPESSVNS